MSELRPADEYRDLFENAPCGYLTMGPDGRISKVNTTLATWMGLGSNMFIGRRLHQFLNMAGRIYYETHIAPLLRMQGFFNEFALDFETAAGERLPVIANAAERYDKDGVLLFTAVVVIKAIDRRRYERELVESRSQLQKGLATERETAELREQFIAVLGHDLRNPLAAISAVRDSRQGLGLGLHIASQIAQAHCGRIDVTSTAEETKFVFKMPLAAAAL